MHKLIPGWLQKGLKHLAWLLAAAIAAVTPVANATDITATDGTHYVTSATGPTIVATEASAIITDTTAPPMEWHGVVIVTLSFSPAYSFNSGVFSANQGGFACELV